MASMRSTSPRSTLRSYRGSLRESFQGSLKESFRGSLRGSVTSSVLSLSEISCPLHPGKSISMVCVTCHDELVCPTCIKIDHRRHEFQELEDIINDKEEVTPLHIDDADHVISQIHNNVSHVKDELKEYNHQVDKVIQQIRNRGHDLKRSIDTAMEESISTCERMRKNSGDKLKKVLDRLLRLENQINKHVHDDKDLLLTRFDTNLIGLSKNSKDDTRPSRPWWSSFLVHIPKFVTANTSPEDLRIIFGVISKEGMSVSSVNTADIGQAYNFFASEQLASPGKTEALEVSPRKICETVNEVTAICPINNSNAWILVRGMDEVNMISSVTGESVRTVTTEGVEINDVTCSVDRTMSVICCADKSVREIGGTYINTKVLFFTEFMPSGLVLTKDQSVIVAFSPGCLIVHYDNRGNLLQKLRGAMAGRIDLDTPKPLRVRQSAYNADLGVFNVGSGYLTVLDSRMRVKFHSACGKRPLNGKFIHTGGISNFMIGDVCFDSAGNIYVVDTLRNSIVVLDKRGTILRTIMNKNDHKPTTVGVQPDGKIWVGFENGTVQTRKPYNC